METKCESLTSKNLIINLIQASLIGKLKEQVDFKPQFLAEAIITKTGFERPFTNQIHQEEIINSVKVFVDSIRNDMIIEMDKLDKDEILLKNFINGQTTACDKLDDFLNKL
jgi:hypothetical protein